MSDDHTEQAPRPFTLRHRLPFSHKFFSSCPGALFDIGLPFRKEAHHGHYLVLDYAEGVGKPLFGAESARRIEAFLQDRKLKAESDPQRFVPDRLRERAPPPVPRLYHDCTRHLAF